MPVMDLKDIKLGSGLTSCNYMFTTYHKLSVDV